MATKLMVKKPAASSPALAKALKSLELVPPAVPKGMQTQMVHFSKLKRYPHNPRRNAMAVPVVARSLKEFGWRQPVVVDKDNFIVVGDTRYQAAGQLAQTDAEWEWIPVVYADDLTEHQITAYRLADNRTGEAAEWDDTLLMQELNMIVDQPFDLVGMGFTEEELNEQTKVVKKEDVRYLEDFDVMPMPKPKFIMISAPEDKCAYIMALLKKSGFGKEVRVEYSGDPSGVTSATKPS